MRKTPSVKQRPQHKHSVLRGRSWEAPESPREFPRSAPREFPGTLGRMLAPFEAVAGVEEACHVLMPASPGRPSQDQAEATGRGKEQAGQQPACFGDRA